MKVKEQVWLKKVERTMAALKKNHIQATLLNSVEEVYKHIDDALFEGAIVSVGGSMTLFETGVIDHLRSGRYHFLDRYKDGLSKEDIRKIYLDSFDADGYFASANAITEDGLIYNVDGTGNRVAAITYGPKKVFLIVSTDKIVRDANEAVLRNERVSAPANAIRLNTKTPCKTTGVCEHCHSPERICCSYSLIGYQRDPERIHVLFIPTSAGY